MRILGVVVAVVVMTAPAVASAQCGTGNACSNHGQCTGGACSCFAGYAGTLCD